MLLCIIVNDIQNDGFTQKKINILESIIKKGHNCINATWASKNAWVLFAIYKY